tara:strand:+ start:1140 stop:1382 length:243 start_codon:yes stop_codon:yes gene_type:complete
MINTIIREWLGEKYNFSEFQADIVFFGIISLPFIIWDLVDLINGNNPSSFGILIPLFFICVLCLFSFLKGKSYFKKPNSK